MNMLAFAGGGLCFRRRNDCAMHQRHWLLVRSHCLAGEGFRRLNPELSRRTK